MHKGAGGCEPRQCSPLKNSECVPRLHRNCAKPVPKPYRNRTEMGGGARRGGLRRILGRNTRRAQPRACSSELAEASFVVHPRLQNVFWTPGGEAGPKLYCAPYYWSRTTGPVLLVPYYWSRTAGPVLLVPYYWSRTTGPLRWLGHIQQPCWKEARKGRGGARGRAEAAHILSILASVSTYPSPFFLLCSSAPPTTCTCEVAAPSRGRELPV